MSEDRFSVDDILKEYSGKKAEHSGIDLDSILNDTPVPRKVSEISPEMRERRLDLINREIISKDYEHKYLGEDFKDVIEVEKRLKAEKEAYEKQKQATAAAASALAASAPKPVPINTGSVPADAPKPLIPDERNPVPREPVPREPVPQDEAAKHIPEDIPLSAAEKRLLEKQRAAEEKKQRKKESRKKHGKTNFEDDEDEFRRKYEFLKSNGLGVKTEPSHRMSPDKEDAFAAAMEQVDSEAGAGRTFSDKMEDSSYRDKQKNSKNTVKILAEKPIDETPKTEENVKTFSAKNAFPSAKGSVNGDTPANTGEMPLSALDGGIGDTKPINVIGGGINIDAEKQKRLEAAGIDIFGKMADSAAGPEEMTRTIPAPLEGSFGSHSQRKPHTPPIERKSITDIDLKLDDKIIPNTAPLNSDDEQMKQHEINELKERRKNKIKDFVFKSMDDDDEAAIPDPDDSEIEDFETMDDAVSVATDIGRLKKNMMLRLSILSVCLVLSLLLTVLNESGRFVISDFLNMKTQPATYLFLNTIIGIVAGFFSFTVISNGLSKLVVLHPDTDSLSAVAFTASLVSSILYLMPFADTNLVRGQEIHEYIPLGIAVLLFNTIGKLLIVSRTAHNFSFISSDSERCAIYTMTDDEKAENFTRGALTDFPMLTAMRKTEMISDFMKTSYSSDSTDRFCRLFTPIIILAALLVGVLGAATGKAEYGTSSIFIGLSAFTGCLCLCSCFSMMLVVNLPMYKGSRKYANLGGAMIGFDSIDEFSDTNSMLADAAQLFPKGSVSLSAIKIFSDTRIDEAIVEAASLTNQSCSIMMSMFYDIIAGKTEMLHPVESYIYEDSMGLCGWINNKRVLLGNRKLMINHSIDGMPSPKKEAEYVGRNKIPVYLSISGELSAMFIIEITPVPEIIKALHDAEKHGIKVILRCVDAAVTVQKMADIFEISPDTIKMIPFRLHTDFEEATSYVPKQSATLACSGRFAAFSALIVGTKKLRGTISAGLIIQAISILLGILISVAMVLLKSFTELSVIMILIYNLVFTAICLILNLFKST